jgi:hypothetical protein
MMRQSDFFHVAASRRFSATITARNYFAKDVDPPRGRSGRKRRREGERTAAACYRAMILAGPIVTGIARSIATKQSTGTLRA